MILANKSLDVNVLNKLYKYFIRMMFLRELADGFLMYRLKRCKVVVAIYNIYILKNRG